MKKVLFLALIFIIAMGLSACDNSSDQIEEIQLQIDALKEEIDLLTEENSSLKYDLNNLITEHGGTRRTLDEHMSWTITQMDMIGRYIGSINHRLDNYDYMYIYALDEFGTYTYNNIFSTDGDLIAQTLVIETRHQNGEYYIQTWEKTEYGSMFTRTQYDSDNNPISIKYDEYHENFTYYYNYIYGSGELLINSNSYNPNTMNIIDGRAPISTNEILLNHDFSVFEGTEGLFPIGTIIGPYTVVGYYRNIK